MVDVLVAELAAGIPDAAGLVRIVTRVLISALLGAIVGYERERAGKPAGLRTHMLVALGSTLFVVSSIEFGMTAPEVSRVVQGLTAGVGFLGAGAILKPDDERHVKGLTTAVGIWMIAAVGVAVGLGRYGIAAISVALTWVILAVGRELELRLERAGGERKGDRTRSKAGET
jgi:putative Mg2+ transporter-C (MgtC) family protein